MGCPKVDAALNGNGASLFGNWRIPDHPTASGGGGTVVAEPWDPTAGLECIGLSDIGYVRFCEPPPDAVPAVSLSDIAHFVPTAPVDNMEPHGMAIIGLNTNFWATSDTHTVDGTLLDVPAQVRFTPVAWHWDYGDGTTRSTSTPGAPWWQLRLKEFDPTATSHVFETKGNYTISLWVDYTAAYRLGGSGWMPIAGSLRLRANDLTVETWHVKTVLVDEDCIANPRGIGC